MDYPYGRNARDVVVLLSPQSANSTRRRTTRSPFLFVRLPPSRRRRLLKSGHRRSESTQVSTPPWFGQLSMNSPRHQSESMSSPPAPPHGCSSWILTTSWRRIPLGATLDHSKTTERGARSPPVRHRRKFHRSVHSSHRSSPASHPLALLLCILFHPHFFYLQ